MPPAKTPHGQQPSDQSPPGIALVPVTQWFAENIPQAAPPLSFELIPSGHSNLTYIVSDSAKRNFVLRRPPLTQVLATAHDMAREYRIILALGSTDVPVPGALGLCLDESVNERPFYVMDFVDGIVLRNPELAMQLAPVARAKVSHCVANLLAKLHRLDPDAIGLGDLGRKENYIARQLRRWKGQLEQSQTTQRQGLFEIHAHLEKHIPQQLFTGIVHGDYRLDNCMVSPSGEVMAVLDWELCTLGDVLADLATLLVYWSEPEDDFKVLETSPTIAPGFASREQMLADYIESFNQTGATPPQLPSIDYYLAFATWRLACILEGVYSRYLIGAMGSKELPGGSDNFNLRIENLISKAAEYAEAV